jgi:hypothetical protein
MQRMKIAIVLVWTFLLAFYFCVLKAGKKRVPTFGTYSRAYSRADERYFRRGVEVAGGEYVGIQECDVDHSLDCVLFNSPLTGSTLAVKVENFSAVAVENKLGEHHHQWEVSQENARLIV